VGLNESGSAEVRTGNLWINGQSIRQLSELRIGESTISNSSGKLFRMPVGKVMFLNLRLCSEAMLCSNLTAGCIVITNAKSIIRTSVSGEAISQDISTTTRRKKRSIGNINIETPSGMFLHVVFIRTLPYGGCPIVVCVRASVHPSQMKFSGFFFYTVSYRNLKLSMRFF
jgi:hypothetical protein